MTSFEQIFIKMDLAGKSTITINRHKISDLSSATTVARLRQAVADAEGVDDVRLIYAGKQLSNDDLTLADYNIHNSDTLTGILRLLGGAEEYVKRADAAFNKNKVEKLQQVKIGDQMVNITVSHGECSVMASDQCLSGDTSVALLHNNHKVCAQCMYNWSYGKVWNGDTTITCPACSGGGSKELPAHVAFVVAGLNDEECKDWDMQLNKNALCFKSCPHCGFFVMKEFKEQRVRCPNPKCKKADFCWLCLNPWAGSDNVYCGNPTCSALADAVYALTESWDKRMEHSKVISNIKHVPEIRCCTNPGCLRLNEHYKNCKHMTCKGKGGCKHQYCHVCLKKWAGCKCAYCEFSNNNAPTCAGNGTQCEIHLLQKI